MRTVMVAAALLLSAACSRSPSEPGRPVDVRLVLAPGQVADIGGASAQIRFDRVTGDSRCPADALCVLGGDALVAVTVVQSGEGTEYVLHTGDMKPARHRDLTIALEQLQPYPFSAHPIDPSDYRATLRITR